MQNIARGTESKSFYRNTTGDCILNKTFFGMANQSPLFNPYDPLVRTEPIFVKESDHIQEQFKVRPVWIIGDLKILHDWMHAPLRKSNWFVDTEKKSLFRHYKLISLTSGSQSLIIELNQKPIIQFDILPNPIKKWRNIRLTHGDDCLMNFLFAENFRKPNLFRAGFECLVACLRSLSGIRFIYVILLQSDKSMDLQLKAIGFESIRFSNFYGKKT